MIPVPPDRERLSQLIKETQLRDFEKKYRRPPEAIIAS
jgi:hypothetical protein